MQGKRKLFESGSPFYLYCLIYFGLVPWKKRQISRQPDKAPKMSGGREEGDEGEDESFVVLMLNELENTIELL